MNEDLSVILEEALRYASPLPVHPTSSQSTDDGNRQHSTQEALTNPTTSTKNEHTTENMPQYHDEYLQTSSCTNDAEIITIMPPGAYKMNTRCHSSDEYSNSVKDKSLHIGSDSCENLEEIHVKGDPNTGYKVLTEPVNTIIHSTEHEPFIPGHVFADSGQSQSSLTPLISSSGTQMSVSPAQNAEHTIVCTQHLGLLLTNEPVLNLRSPVGVCVPVTSNSQCDDPLAIIVQQEDSPLEVIVQTTEEMPKKKKRRREKNPDPPPEAILPPCKICDEKSSGYHYGANTCEACKGFFRRTLKKKEVNYKCKCKPEERDIWKRGPYKNGCPSCRYERCLDVGMSKNAIKIGRYTTDHKTSNIKEVKCLETFERLQDKQTTPVATPSSSDMMDVENLIEEAFAQVVFESSPKSGDSGIESPGSALTLLHSGPIDLSVGTPSSSSNPPSVSSVEPMDLSMGSPATLEPPIKKRFTETMPDYLKAGLTLKEIDTIVKTLTEAHRSTQFLEEIPIEQIKQRHTEYLERYKLKTQMFGQMKSLTHSEFAEFYKATGIDIDGRLDDVHTALDFFQKKIALIVAFGKAIPGFKELTLDDQANLIKSSRMENTLMGGYKALSRNVDFKRQVVITPWGKECHFDEIGRFHPLELLIERFQFAAKVLSLDLSPQEAAVTRAILILFTDRCQLNDPDKADAIQEKLIFCLQHLLNVRHGGPGTMFYKIISLVTDLRVLTEHDANFARKMMSEPMVSQSMNNYTLIREFLT